MAVTYIPGPDYSHWARVFSDIADIYLRNRDANRAREDQRDENALKFITTLAQGDPVESENQLRAIEASPGGAEAFKRLTGNDIRSIGTTVAGFSGAGTPGTLSNIRPVRTVAPGMQESLANKGKRLEVEGKQLNIDSVRQAMGIAAKGEERAAAGEKRAVETHGINMAITENEAMKAFDTYRFTDATGRDRKATPSERAAMLRARKEGKSFDEAVSAAGFTGSAIPDVLVAQVDDMTNSLTKLGYSPEMAAQHARDFVVTHPMELSRLEPLSKQALLDYHLAETALTRAKLAALNDPNAPLKPNEQRLRTEALDKAHVRAYEPWYGAGLSSTRVAADGTLEVTPGWVGKKTAKSKVGWTDSNGVTHPTLPARMVDALIDPLGPSGMAWLIEHGIQPPISPDDVTGIRAVLDAFARETGARIDKITLNVPDPTAPTASRRTIPQDIIGYEGIINFVTADRASLMRERVLNGSVPQQGSVSYPGPKPTGLPGGSANDNSLAPVPGQPGGGVGVLPPSADVGAASQPSMAPAAPTTPATAAPSALETAIKAKLAADQSAIDAMTAERVRRNADKR